MTTTQPVCDKTYRQAYLRLLLKKLKECKSTPSDQIAFTPQEKQVIEYHLKDVAREAVLENTSLEECVGIFCERIKRLVSAEKTEWERVRELIQKNARHITPDEIIDFDNLSHYFHRINQKHRSEN